VHAPARTVEHVTNTTLALRSTPREGGAGPRPAALGRRPSAALPGRGSQGRSVESAAPADDPSRCPRHSWRILTGLTTGTERSGRYINAAGGPPPASRAACVSAPRSRGRRDRRRPGQQEGRGSRVWSSALGQDPPRPVPMESEVRPPTGLRAMAQGRSTGADVDRAPATFWPRMRSTRRPSANANCPGASGSRGGQLRQKNGAAARSAVCHEGVGRGARAHAKKPQLRTGTRSAVQILERLDGVVRRNMTPRREITASNCAGSNG